MKSCFFYMSISMLLISACTTEQSSIESNNVKSNLTGKLIITGSSTIAPLVLELARKFEIKHPESRIDVQTGGSSRGIADVKNKVADIGMVSRELLDKEIKTFTGHLLARDGISIIVNNTNPTHELENQQIIDIYTGKITNWHSLTGKDAEITVIHKAEGRSTLDVFLQYFKIKNKQIKPDIIIGDNEQGIKLVAKNPDAIAYVSIGTAEYDIKQGVTIKTLPLNQIEANTHTLAKGQFPLNRELNFVTLGPLNQLANHFIQFAVSTEANSTISEFGFVPIN